MTEPTITCPNWKTEIKLTESLAAPLIAATRKQFEQQLALENDSIASQALEFTEARGHEARGLGIMVALTQYV